MPKPKQKRPKKTNKRVEEASAESHKEPQDTSSTQTVLDITALPVWQIIPFFIGVFDRIAWQKMGLVVNPQSQEIEKDLEQARVAIDSYELLLAKLGEHIEPDAKKALASRLTDLKLNYAQQA